MGKKDSPFWIMTTIIALTVIFSNNIIEFLGNLGFSQPNAVIIIILSMAALSTFYRKIALKIARLF